MSIRSLQETAIVADRTVTTVNTTTTILAPATNAKAYDFLSLEIINDDVAQVLSAQVEASRSASGPWAAQNSKVIAAGGAWNAVIDVRGAFQIRVTGTASGAGLSARVGVTIGRSL